MSRKKLILSTETVLSLSAILIAFASIFISIWEGIQMREHNRLSVRPRLEIIYERNQQHIGYTLYNKGLGPATILEKQFFVDGKKTDQTGFAGFDDLLDNLKLTDTPIYHDAIGTGIIMKEGEKLSIITFDMQGKNDFEKHLTEIYQRVSIEINYESMYKESFICKFPKEN